MKNIIFVSLAVISMVSWARKMAEPAEPSEVTTEWVGFTEDNLNFYDIILLPEGRGVLTSYFVDYQGVEDLSKTSGQRPLAYFQIEKWTLDGPDLTILAKPHSRNSGVIEKSLKIETSVYGGTKAMSKVMSGKVGGANGWSRKITLHKKEILSGVMDRAGKETASLLK